MNRRAGIVIGLLLWSVGTMVGGVTAWLLVVTVVDQKATIDQLGFPLALLVNAAAFVTVGAFLGARLPRHPVGWLLAGWGSVMVLTAAVGVVEMRILAAGGPLEPLAWIQWTWATLWHPSFALLFLLLLLFPDGRLPSPRWRPVAGLGLAWYAALALATAFSSEAVSLYAENPSRPVGVPTSSVADAAIGVLLPGQLGFVLLGLSALLLRWSRASGKTRVQISWFVYAVAVAVLAFVGGLVVFGGGVLFPVFGVIPLAAGYAVLRRRLYDIGRVVRRTVSYAILAGLVAAAYTVGVIGMQWLLPGGASDAAVALTTLGVAGAFHPVRRHVQGLVEHRFNRSGYDSRAVTQGLAQRLRDEFDAHAVVTVLCKTVTRTLEPERVGLWRPRTPPGTTILENRHP